MLVGSRRVTVTADSAHDKRGGEIQDGVAGRDNSAAIPLSMDERKTERILATTRALLAASLLGVITAASGSFAFSYLYWLFVPGYCAYSIVLIACLRRQLGITRRTRVVAQIVDLLWAGLLIILFLAVTPHTPFLVFLIFALLAAMMRFGFRATIGSLGIGTAVLLPVAWMLDFPIVSLAKEVQRPENNILSIGSGLLLTVGFLIGYFGEREGQFQSDASAVARVASHICKSVRPDPTVVAIFNELFDAFEPAQVQLALHEVATGQIHVWRLNRSDDSHDPKLIRREIDFSFRDQLFFGDNGGHLLGTLMGELDRTFKVRVFRSGQMTSEQPYTLTSILFPNRFRSFICVPLVFGDEWEVRIFLWEPTVRRLNRRTILAVAEACDRLGPMIFAAALQEYLGRRATAEERARFVRELHDGMMQSLAAVDLRMTAVAEQVDQELPERGKELLSIQQTIRSEVAGLRELIHRNRLTEIAPARLLPFLSETLSRFQRDVGIAARFLCELDEVDLPAGTCYEVARIVQEALTNVRKHSGAKNVAVRLNKSHGQYLLVITDDGHGFHFVGRHTFSELDAAREGPFVIKERVRAISGDITVESLPERGTRIEITFPMEKK